MNEEDKKENDSTEAGATEDKKENTASSLKSNALAIVIVAALVIGALQFTGSIDVTAGLKPIAEVNGESISEKEFNKRYEQILNSPQAQALNLADPSFEAQVKQQVLTEIINTRLLLQNAREAGFGATDEEVQTEYDLIVERLGSEVILEQELTNGGLSVGEFRDNVRDQILIEKYLDSQIDESQLIVTDDEVEEFYTAISENSEDIPPLDDIRFQIFQQLELQKQQTQVGTVVLTLRAEAEIKEFVSFISEQVPALLQPEASTTTQDNQ